MKRGRTNLHRAAARSVCKRSWRNWYAPAGSGISTGCAGWRDRGLSKPDPDFVRRSHCGVDRARRVRFLPSQLPGERHLGSERCRALQLLASSSRGATENPLVLAHGFSRDMLAGLVLAGLATVVTET
jgi:hypothetical protein